ncbi:14050_t:CDS:2 [Cetraspora pellucida]|uniref:14050_t:CDS:1 n=1 Tax=Cetraspora pellucida TaxID=1433469 RepID=A0A9N9FA42_9GLOM|nr:14050_t:CDS:2 [Cetraspora pellucida]
MHIWLIFILLSILSLPLGNTLPFKSLKPITIPLKKSNANKLFARDNPPTVNEPLTDDFHRDDQYFCEITLGGQKFNVMVDTALGDLLIPSINCTSACDFKNKYNPHNDVSFGTKNKTFGYVYGNGLVEGIRGHTIMNIGGYAPGSRHLDLSPYQEFGLVSIFPNIFKFTEFDGILGLAITNKFNPDESNFYNNIYFDYLSPLFTLKIGREADGTDSELTIGAVDQNKFIGEIVYTTTINNDYWILPIDDLIINGQSLGFQNRTGKISSAYSSIVIPFDDAKLIYQHLPNVRDRDGKFIIPCDSIINIEIKINNTNWAIDHRDLIDVRQFNDIEICSGMIRGGITESDKEWILGTTFLKNVYSVYNDYNHTIGLAKLNLTKLSAIH